MVGVIIWWRGREGGIALRDFANLGSCVGRLLGTRVGDRDGWESWESE